jgi:broad specificity phosphatase PhoE
LRQKQDLRFPDGETSEDAHQGTATFLDEKQKQHNGENIVIVCHEGLVHVTACHIGAACL